MSDRERLVSLTPKEGVELTDQEEKCREALETLANWRVEELLRMEREYPELLSIVRGLAKIRQLADDSTPLVSNQGQALDGYSELAMYRKLAEKAQAFKESPGD